MAKHSVVRLSGVCVKRNVTPLLHACRQSILDITFWGDLERVVGVNRQNIDTNGVPHAYFFDFEF